MLDRRQFLTAAGGSLLLTPFASAAQQSATARKRLAVVTTLWKYGTHAWHMAERFLHGYPKQGRWHRPGLDVVAAYVDQQPDGDLSRRRAQENGFSIYPTIAEALRCGGEKLAVDAVLLIGEHGDYPLNEFGQKLYPRHRLFTEIANVFRIDGRSVPVFNDKHLSWSFDLAQEMVDLSRELKFPLLAGSSLPVTWRMPSVEMPLGAEIEEGLVVAYGSKDIYDFHAIETLQCMMERRRGGETGVASVLALEGDELWRRVDAGDLPGGWSPQLFEACLSRSQTLRQPESFSHRYPTADQIREWGKDARGYFFRYVDGTRGTVLMLNGVVQDFNFAARLKGREAPLSTLFYLPPNPNVVYSAALMDNAEQMFLTGKAPYPIERTLLTSGLVEAALQSLTRHQPLKTPHLDVTYSASQESTFWRE
ncbi:hypothetical protein GC176_16170 [bacterium]|nr:hypothetical protein [bacterium]